MCELFGICFEKPVAVDEYLTLFWQRSSLNPHGWGMALYPPGSRCSHIAREPVKAAESDYAAFMTGRFGLGCSLALAHVRHSSIGAHILCNTHPFVRECRGIEYVFTHNGNIEDFHRVFPLGHYHPFGETDSEHLFCNLMAEIDDAAVDLPGPGGCAALHGQLAQFNASGSFNCMLSDGATLYCYHDKDGTNGLCCLEKEIDGNRGYVISTKPLTDENWVAFEQGSLAVFQSGHMTCRINSTQKII
jgi:predicted glutamine amidotransferase